MFTVYSQRRDGYEVHGYGQEGGGSEVLWRARMLRRWEDGCEVLLEHGADSGKHEDKQSRRCRAPILGAAAMSLVGFFAIWNGRRKKPPSRLRRDLGLTNFLGFKHPI